MIITMIQCPQSCCCVSPVIMFSLRCYLSWPGRSLHVAHIIRSSTINHNGVLVNFGIIGLSIVLTTHLTTQGHLWGTSILDKNNKIISMDHYHPRIDVYIAASSDHHWTQDSHTATTHRQTIIEITLSRTEVLLHWDTAPTTAAMWALVQILIHFEDCGVAVMLKSKTCGRALWSCDITL